MKKEVRQSNWDELLTWFDGRNRICRCIEYIVFGEALNLIHDKMKEACWSDRDELLTWFVKKFGFCSCIEYIVFGEAIILIHGKMKEFCSLVRGKRNRSYIKGLLLLNVWFFHIIFVCKKANFVLIFRILIGIFGLYFFRCRRTLVEAIKTNFWHGLAKRLEYAIVSSIFSLGRQLFWYAVKWMKRVEAIGTKIRHDLSKRLEFSVVSSIYSLGGGGGNNLIHGKMKEPCWSGRDEILTR